MKTDSMIEIQANNGQEAAELQQHADELRSYSNLIRQIDDLDELTPIR
jgi:hypothetical protein